MANAKVRGQEQAWQPENGKIVGVAGGREGGEPRPQGRREEFGFDFKHIPHTQPAWRDPRSSSGISQHLDRTSALHAPDSFSRSMFREPRDQEGGW